MNQLIWGYIFLALAAVAGGVGTFLVQRGTVALATRDAVRASRGDKAELAFYSGTVAPLGKSAVVEGRLNQIPFQARIAFKSLNARILTRFQGKMLIVSSDLREGENGLIATIPETDGRYTQNHVVHFSSGPLGFHDKTGRVLIALNMQFADADSNERFSQTSYLSWSGPIVTPNGMVVFEPEVSAASLEDKERIISFCRKRGFDID